ncbi:hypothetical protein M378DRAFT_70503 [Amanita muscaria Koide BX008]|uniref:Conserved oligomeric Golgi complex subunit 5 n=1 Tax=Amanita muscaria (strain Koide BX008) TaxID=946122 RepID=A0A0C2XIV8_AMAMK|nr:hypothetical protein M378DRAFT_70503 [Amanita muscaria Koide BX008]
MLAEFAIFASPDFVPSEYANAILAREPRQEPPAKEDVSEAISKLTYAVEDVTNQIKQLVSQHHEDLLTQAANSNDLSESFTSVRESLTELDKSLEKLRSKVHEPYRSLATHVTRLRRLQQATDLLRRTSRFVTLARRLHVQMAELNTLLAPEHQRQQIEALSNILSHMDRDTRDELDRALAKAALSLAELMVCLDESVGKPQQSAMTESRDKFTDTAAKSAYSLRSIKAVAGYIPLIDDSQIKVTNVMEIMLYAGLESRNSAMLASSLQIAYNLRVLPDLVQTFLSELTRGMEDQVRSAFDMSRLSKDAINRAANNTGAHSSSYKSRVRTEPTNVTAPQWTTILWERIEGLIQEIAESCIKVYALENILNLKRDAVTQTLFLDEAMKSLENKPSNVFWTTLARSLEKSVRDSVKGSTFMQQALGTGYPKLLRLVQAFFAQITPHTDTVYTQSHQSPEAILVLNALSSLEALFLSKSLIKMNEAVGQAFAGGSRAPPSTTEGLNIARVIANELDASKFDPLLVKSVARNVIPVINTIRSRVESLVIRDRSASSLIGPAATPQQIINAQITTCLYQCWSKLGSLREEHPDTVFTMLRPSIHELHNLYKSLIEPISTGIRREIGAILSRLHRVDLGKPMDPTSGLGANLYIRDLSEKLSFIKTEILSRYNLDEANRTWAISICNFTVKTFLLHVSIAKPLSESGKLQLTNDMTELEFSLSAFLAEGSQGRRNAGLELIGEDYLALRAMRPLLFLNNEQLVSPVFTRGLRPLFVLHHILVRSPIPLPHALHGWQEAEYVRWVDEHSEEEAWALVESGLEHWEKVSESEGIDIKDARIYADMARKVLRDARESI